MNFYVSLVFLGAVLVVVSLVLVVFDKKKVFSFARDYDKKKQELVEIINDAEQMIEELNKFSDYIVTQMDLKNEELRMNLRVADEEIKSLAQSVREIKGETAGNVVKEEHMEAEPINDYRPAAVVNGGAPADGPMPAGAACKQNVDVVYESRRDVNPISMPVYQPPRPTAKKTEKIIPMKNRYSEVLRLAETGLGELEIARMLNMGKGEVELILGLNKN